jgi:hypothetical protein
MARPNIVQVTLETEQIGELKRQAALRQMRPLSWARLLLARALEAERRRRKTRA